MYALSITTSSTCDQLERIQGHECLIAFIDQLRFLFSWNIYTKESSKFRNKFSIILTRLLYKISPHVFAHIQFTREKLCPVHKKQKAEQGVWFWNVPSSPSMSIWNALHRRLPIALLHPWGLRELLKEILLSLMSTCLNFNKGYSVNSWFRLKTGVPLLYFLLFSQW